MALGPTPFGRPGPHLGARIDALADGQVDADQRDRLLAHATHCPACRSDLLAAREVKAQLGRLDAPLVPMELTSRLLSLSALPPAAVPHDSSTAGADLAFAQPGRRSYAGAAGLGLLVGTALLVAVPTLAPTGATRQLARPTPSPARSSSTPAPRLPEPPTTLRAAVLLSGAVRRPTPLSRPLRSRPVEELDRPQPLLAATLER